MCLMFFMRLISNDSPCFMRVKNYFMEKSYFKENLESIFSLKYNVRDVLDNDTDANYQEFFIFKMKNLHLCMYLQFL